MVIPNEIRWNDDGSIREINTEGLSNIPGCDRWPLLEFTGLKDKNGVEIFEGDIVKCGYFTDFDEKSKRKWHDFVGVIECENLGWLTCGKINWHELNTATARVIGNVFSNPELLKGEGAE